MLAILAFIHQRQILHRDIKPSNIIRRASDGQWVLIDFGIGRQAFTPDDRTTTAIGSQGYVAPEQEQGKAVPASDLYALGVVTIEAATGKRFASLRHLPAPQHRVPLAQSFASAESPADPVPSTAPLSLNTQPLGTQPLNTAPLPPKADAVPAPRSRPWRQAAPQLSDPLLALIDSFVDPDVSHRPASATAALDALTGLSG
jgi:serine/threonine protein kinase